MGGRTHQKEAPFYPDQNVPSCEFHTLARECGEHDISNVRILLFSSTQFNPAHTYWFLLCSRQWASHSGVSREKSKFCPPATWSPAWKLYSYQQLAKYLNSTYVTQNSKHFIYSSPQPCLLRMITVPKEEDGYLCIYLFYYVLLAPCISFIFLCMDSLVPGINRCSINRFNNEWVFWKGRMVFESL